MTRLALTKDGRVTKCMAPPDQRGIGRCNHVEHQLEDETLEGFFNRVTPNKVVAQGELHEDGELVLDKEVKHYPLQGSYDKTVVILNGRIHYLKFDTSKAHTAESTLYYDIRSSVAESAASLVAQHSDIKDRIRCANYQLVKVNGQLATLSEDLYEESENEVFLSTDYSNGLIPKAEYLDAVQWSGDRLVQVLSQTEFGDEEASQQYIRDLSGFDELVGNTDRRQNAYNCAFGHDFLSGKFTPVNLDYGRCFCINYTKTTEQAIQRNPDIFDDELIEDFSHIKSASTLCSAHQLESLGFQKFKLDIDAIEKGLDDIVNKCDGTDCTYYSKLIKESVMRQLKSKKGILWEDK